MLSPDIDPDANVDRGLEIEGALESETFFPPEEIAEDSLRGATNRRLLRDELLRNERVIVLKYWASLAPD